MDRKIIMIISLMGLCTVLAFLFPVFGFIRSVGFIDGQPYTDYNFFGFEFRAPWAIGYYYLGLDYGYFLMPLLAGLWIAFTYFFFKSKGGE